MAVALIGGALPACGGSVVDVAVAVTANDKAPLKPGDQRTFTVTVENKGPGQATRINLHVDLPAECRYKSTVSLGGDAARTQPVDAAVNSSSPVWGSWSLSAPGTNPNGSPHNSQLILVFAVDVEGKPGNYLMQARASGDNTEGDVTASPLAVQVAPAAKLDASIAGEPPTARTNQFVYYRVTISNNGTGPAEGLSILVTMPAMLAYTNIQSTEGNSSRGAVIDPIKNASEPFFASYTLPARTDAGPGLLTIVFRAKVAPSTVAGPFTVSLQVTDDGGEIKTIRDTAPVTITP